MTEEELLRMVGLENVPDEYSGVSLEAVEAERDSGPVSVTAVGNLDEWDVAKGEELFDSQHRQATLAEWQDFHAAAFKPDPELAEKCVDPRRLEFISGLLEHPDWQHVRQYSVLDPMLSEMAACQACDRYTEVKRKDSDRQIKPSGKPGKDEFDAENDMAEAVSNAANKASEEVEEMAEACRGIGQGVGGGSTDPKKAVELYKRIKNDPRLRKICDLAGKYRRVAQSKQRQKVSHGVDEVVGVELSGDMSRVLPSELVKLTDPELELDALRRLAERQLMSLEKHSKETVGKGPIVVVVDESGSMSGDPICQAKALALALGWIAKKQNRWVAFVGFSGGTEGTRVCFPPGKWDQEKLLDWLSHFFNGGTSCDVPVKELPTIYWDDFVKAGLKRGKTDVVMICDGLINVPKPDADRFNDWKKKEKVRVTALMVGSQAGGLSGVCDEVVKVGKLDVKDEKIGDLLSL